VFTTNEPRRILGVMKKKSSCDVEDERSERAEKRKGTKVTDAQQLPDSWQLHDSWRREIKRAPEERQRATARLAESSVCCSAFIPCREEHTVHSRYQLMA
jgi:hypothetical protein